MNYIYSPEKKTHLHEYDVDIWQGFRYEVRCIEQIPMLNIDMSYLVVKGETALEVVNEIKRAHETFGKDSNTEKLHKDIRRALVGKIVSTRYNNNLYRIKDVDFNQNPECYFV